MGKKLDFSGQKWPQIEETILDFWEKGHIFKKTLKKTKNAKPYVFYDGPPFATGTPHYGHLEQSIIKDAVPRYWTMRGRHVERKWGWDCHGLPVENIVEKDLGLKEKQAIEELGIDKFNHSCRSTVMKYADVWKKMIPRIGRWVDMDDDYRTMEDWYIESVWWAFAELHKKGLAYEGTKNMHVCPRCETTLSNFEVAQGYKDVTDTSVVWKFPVVGEENTYLLAWTTTPWSTLSTMGLSVGPKFDYVKAKVGDEFLIFAKERLEFVLGEQEHEIVKEMKGKDLAGMAYEPLADFYKETPEVKGNENTYRVFGGDYVEVEEGTGIVTINGSYGEIDMEAAKKNGLPILMDVGIDGRFKPVAKEYAGLKVQEAQEKFIKNSETKGLVWRTEPYQHSYPHCWRCDTPLLNYSTSSWFVAVEKIKEALLKNNQKINWVPENVKDGRMGKWLEGARDWAVSRNRYWGATIPVWKCQSCDEVKVVGSAAELPGWPKYKNKYVIMRHGEADHNVKDVMACLPETPETISHLTDWGREQVKNRSEGLKDMGIDLVLHSPLARAVETKDAVLEMLGKVETQEDERLKEIDVGKYNGQPEEKYKAAFNSPQDRYNKKVPGAGETLQEVQDRMHAVVEETEGKMQGKTILIISHGDPLWALEAKMTGKTFEQAGCFTFPQVGGWRQMRPYPVDLHRPFIDEVEFDCQCGAKMRRIPDVFDCWFESGSMPYASLHYPFENKDKFKERFPAQFIAEAQDQTRGWFYTLSVLATALFEKPTFENSVVTGLILAEDGKKMSKRLKNYPEPDEVIDKYGADPMRLFLLGSPLMKGETVNFSEKGLDEMQKKVIMLLKNVTSFYNLYAEGQPAAPKAKDALDVWMLAKLKDLVRKTDQAMEAYDISAPVREVISFVDELSTWYVRRSRGRMKAGGAEQAAALAVLHHCLLELSKVIAPFAPFLAEYVYAEIGGKEESVHLEDWPRPGKPSKKERESMEKMAAVREIVSAGLAARADSGIKVRQPLAKAEIYDENKRLNEKDTEYLDLIKEELNVLEILLPVGAQNSVPLQVDLDLEWKSNPELVALGIRRELVRHINMMRKEMGLTIQDRVVVGFRTDEPEVKDAVEKYGEELAGEVLADEIAEGEREGEEKEVKINQATAVLFVKKV